MDLESEVDVDDDQWLPVSDLMAGLMIVFLFISISVMTSAFKERDEARKQTEKMERIANEYVIKHKAIYKSLNQEFATDFDVWDVDHDEDSLTVTFNSPEVQFRDTSAIIPVKFESILGEFFPRYVRILEPYRDYIQEVRLEGHTSSVWRDPNASAGGYFGNMGLSQLRTLSVLEYIYGLPAITHPDREWIKNRVAAVGRSFSHLVLSEQGVEDTRKSRRVTFRVVTNADREIRRILESPR